MVMGGSPGRPVRTVLITGTGAPGCRGTIYALRRSPVGRSLRIVGVDAQADVVGRFLVDRFHAIPEPEDRSYIEVLSDICRIEGVEIVLPQTTRELPVLSRHRAAYLDQGIRVLVSDAATIEVVNNKWKLSQEFAQLGLPIAAGVITQSEGELVEAAERLGYPGIPVVVKPPVSNGMRGVRVLTPNAWDVHRFLTEKPDGLEISLGQLVAILRRGGMWPELLVTEYLPGPEYSVDAFVGEKLAVAIPRLRKAIRGGISFETIVDSRTDLRDYTLAVAQRTGLRYAFGMQYRLDVAGVPKVLECNPRVQGTMVASVFAGVNVIGLAVQETLGAVPATPVPQVQPARFYRFWGGIGVCDGDVDEI